LLISIFWGYQMWHWCSLVKIAGCFLALLSCVPVPASAQRRAALVIGNSAYENTNKLPNPVNDATDVSVKLRQLGFEVVEGHDLHKEEMDRLMRRFADSLIGADIALFFYAGHGLQVEGENYLVPVEAKLSTAAALEFEMIRLGSVQKAMEREATTNILILDACRDNPLARNLARAMKTRSTAVGRGLAAMETGEGTLISFSTQPGNVALDGSGRNSPFVTALLKHIATPGDDLPTILINIRNDVMTATERRQVPWEHSALTSKVFFTPAKPTTPTVEQQIELAFWASVKDSPNAEVLKTYLQRYPNGEFVAIARTLVQHYEQQQQADRAKRDAEVRAREVAEKSAEVHRLEEQRRALEETLAEERRRAQEAKSEGTTDQVQQARQDEVGKLTKELQKALDEAAAAREVARIAEQKRLAAVKSAEEAKSAAEAAISAKREMEKARDPAKTVALPKLEKPAEPSRNRPDPTPYSHRIWRPGSIRDGDSASTITEYGRLTCFGGNTRTGKPRLCHWR
jgi:uncharacterized caspase-like protein